MIYLSEDPSDYEIEEEIEEQEENEESPVDYDAVDDFHENLIERDY